MVALHELFAAVVEEMVHLRPDTIVFRLDVAGLEGESSKRLFSSNPVHCNHSASSAYSIPITYHTSKGADIEDCRHDDVYLYTGEDHHVITCNQCDRWWWCYMDLADAWTSFTKYGRGDGSDPPTVGISCSPKAWSATGRETETER